jgi:DNA repair exonuclease SbcCD ATPase subunit
VCPILGEVWIVSTSHSNAVSLRLTINKRREVRPQSAHRDPPLVGAESSRRENLSLKETIHQLGRDIAALQDSDSRTVRSQRNCDGAVSDMRRDALRTNEKADAALASSAETSAALATIRSQIAELTARCGAADQRARDAEQSAADAHRENAELRSRLDSQRHEQERRCDNIDAAIERALAAQRDSQAAITTSLAALNAAFERSNRDIAALSAQHSDVAASLDALRSQTADADAALAKDVSMLNDVSSAVRAQQAADASALTARIKATADAAREAVRQEAEERERRLAALARKAAGDSDDLRRGIAGLESSLQRAKASLEEHERVALSESRTIGAQLAGLEASVHAQAAETGRRVDDLGRQHGARLDALANAVHAFANVLNLGHVVVDPKAILSRATSALRGASPERHVVGGSSSSSNFGHSGIHAGSASKLHEQQQQHQRLGSSMVGGDATRLSASGAGAPSRFGSPSSRNLF